MPQSSSNQIAERSPSSAKKALRFVLNTLSLLGGVVVAIFIQAVISSILSGI